MVTVGWWNGCEFKKKKNFYIISGFYFTNDLAHRDAAGDYKIIGREGDAIRNHDVWLSVTEIESVMVSR